MAYHERAQACGDAPGEPAHDRLLVTATNVRTVTVDVARAGVTCGAELDVDGPLTIVLSGCGRVEQFQG